MSSQVNGVMYIAATDMWGDTKLYVWKQQCTSVSLDDDRDSRCTHQKGHGPVEHKGSSYKHGAPQLGLWWNTD